MRDAYCNISFAGARQVTGDTWMGPDVTHKPRQPASVLGHATHASHAAEPGPPSAKLHPPLLPLRLQVTPVVRQSQSPTWNYSALFPLDMPHLEEGAHVSGSGAPAVTPGITGAGDAHLSVVPSSSAPAFASPSPSPTGEVDPLTKLRPPHLLLRIDMKDVDPLPPDDDLG